MSYQVLARKYRPRNFETLVGQEHVVRALTHALGTGRLHHAYLFTGTRGVGKTTLSRILAKSLNCTGPDGSGGVTATPCGVCEACTAIDAGRFVDYIEMDAASNRGVDEMAQLLEQAIYAPSNARYKVYMIDEVHMLTNHAFNAMLKTLEEPPEHVKFILATTDPQKIPVTVLSRCLQFNLKQMPPGHIIGHLENILGQEGISFDQPALRLLAHGAHGSMRDALSLTDQAIAYAAGQVTLDAVQGMLGALDQSYLVRLLDALANQDGADLMAVADEMASRSLSYNGALQDLGTLLHRVALAQTVPTAVPEDLPELADIRRLAEVFDPQEVQLYYQIAVHGRNEIGLAPDEYAGFTMTLLRMLAFRPGMGGAEGGGGSGPERARAATAARPAPAARPAMAAATAARPGLPTQGTGTAPAMAAAVPTQTASGSAAPSAPAQAVDTGAAPAAPAAAPAASAQSAETHAVPVAPVAPAQPAGAHEASATAAAPAAQAETPAQAASVHQAAPTTNSASNPPAPAEPARSAPMTSARAAINAALEAARAASGGRGGGTARPAAPPPAAPRPPAASAPIAVHPPVGGAASSAPVPASMPAAARPLSPSAPSGPVMSAAPKMPPPWEAAPQGAEDTYEDVLTDEEPPSWATESFDDGAVAAAAPAAAPAVRAKPAAPTEPYVITPVPELDWDGNWPALAASLPLRGVAQQLALQTQLIECKADAAAATIRLKVPVDTLRASGNTEKLAAALQERFPSRRINLDIEIGPVWYTANAEAQAGREECQRKAEETVANDPFVQTLMRDFGAMIVPGSVRPSADTK